VIANRRAQRNVSRWRWIGAGAVGVLLVLGFMQDVPYTQRAIAALAKLEWSRRILSPFPLHKAVSPADTLQPAAERELVLPLPPTATDAAGVPAVSSSPTAANAVPLTSHRDTPATRAGEAPPVPAPMGAEARVSALSLPLATTHAEPLADIGPLPPLPIPEGNPLTPEKVELGKRLFFDPRLSGDGSMACVSCHLPDQGWTTNTPLSPAYPTNMERRNSQTLINVAYNQALLWDGRAGTLEKQALGPIQNPLHMNQNLDLLIEKLQAIPMYAERFQQVFGTPVTPEGLGKALAAFERTLVTRNAPFDRYMTGDWQAMSADAL
jgi:hypothetical protein